MTASLALIVAVGAAYLAAHVVFDWLARRFLIVSGAEYLVLGILFGPQVSGVLSAPLVASLAPILTLALGWIGTIIGVQFDLRTLIGTPARDFRVAFAESTLTFLLVGAVELLVFERLLGASEDQATLAAVAVGALAVTSSSVGITLVTELTSASGRVVDQLRVSSMINAFVAIAIFGLLLCIHHAPAPTPGTRPLTATEWAVVSVAIGIVGGMLFHIFLGETPDPDRLFVSLVGGIVMVSGAATYLHLSPLLSAGFFGATLVNTTAKHEALVSTLTRVERPFYFVLLIFAGAAWEPSQQAWVLPVLLFVVARMAAKIGGSRLAARANGALGELGDHFGRALLGQGRVAVAIGLSYLRQEGMPFRNLVFTAAIISVLVTEFLSARTARGVITRHIGARPLNGSDMSHAASHAASHADGAR